MKRARSMGHVAESKKKAVLKSWNLKVPAESPRCSVEESMEEKGPARSVSLKSEVGRTFVLLHYIN